jgi:subtilisin-like proprotein convertase family protein
MATGLPGVTRVGIARLQGGSIVKLHQISLFAMAIVLTAALGLAEPLSAAGPHAEGKKSKTQHKTFSSPNALLIPDNSTANPYPSAIEVSGFKKGKVTDVDLTLRGFNHGYTHDVDVLLVAPNGRNAIVMSDVGNASAASLTITLDDQATDPLPVSGPLESGTFRPADYINVGDPFPGAPTPSGDVALSTFKGINPNGAWQLFVVDDTGGNNGAFSGGWDLKITAKVKKNKKAKKH